MNLSELIEEVNKDLDDSLDNGDVTGWINRALDDLTPITKKEAKAVIGIAASMALPEDLFELSLLLTDEGELYPLTLRDKTSKGYKVWGNELTLQNGPSEGDIELYYYKCLAHLEEDEDTPEIDPSYHDLLILYAVAHSQYAEEEPERQIDAMNRYLARKREYESFILRKSFQSNEIIDVTRW